MYCLCIVGARQCLLRAELLGQYKHWIERDCALPGMSYWDCINTDRGGPHCQGIPTLTDMSYWDCTLDKGILMAFCTQSYQLYMDSIILDREALCVVIEILLLRTGVLMEEGGCVASSEAATHSIL